MAGRAYWKGCPLSCPIALSPATSDSEWVKFRSVNKETGNRVPYQFVDAVTREEVLPENRGKGYEVAKGEFLILDDAELEAIELESTHTYAHDMPQAIRVNSLSANGAMVPCLYRPIKVDGKVVDSQWFRFDRPDTCSVLENPAADAA